MTEQLLIEEEELIQKNLMISNNEMEIDMDYNFIDNSPFIYKKVILYYLKQHQSNCTQMVAKR